MKCKNCSGQLFFSNGMYICNFCRSQFFKEEIFVTNNPSPSEFIIVGGELKAYQGNNPNVVIPEGVVQIGLNAFKNNIQLKTIKFSKTVKCIGKNAFEGCVNLERLIDNDFVETYDDYCFRNAGLKEINIGANVKVLGRYCFSNMPNLVKVIYKPKKNIKLNNTFAHCANLKDVDLDQFYFFPSFHTSLEVKNNSNNKRPTFADAFAGTPFIKIVIEEYMNLYKQGICPECNGKISKGLFHARCKNCGIDYKN